MFWFWSRPKKVATLSFWIAVGDQEIHLIDKEIQMNKCDLSIGVTVTQNGAKFLTVPPITWHGLSDESLADAIKHSDAALGEAAKVANKGGDLTMVVTRAVSGAATPAGSGSKTFSGLTLDGLNDFQDAMHDHAGDLRRASREHASRKHGGHR